MKSKYFEEVGQAGRGKPWSRYNFIPEGLSELETSSCESCNYRVSRLKELFVRTIFGVVGFRQEDYNPRDYMGFTPNCDRTRCLLDKLVLKGEAKASPSFKRLLNPNKLLE